MTALQRPGLPRTTPPFLRFEDSSPSSQTEDPNAQTNGVRSRTTNYEGRTPEMQVVNTKGLPGEAVENVHEFGQALGAIGIALRDAFGDTLFDVETENGEADAVERRFRGRELLEDLDAQARFLHHAADAAHLAFDPVQARDDGLLLGFVQHGLTLT